MVSRMCGGLQADIPYDKIVKINKEKKMEENYHDSETDFKYPEDKRTNCGWS